MKRIFVHAVTCILIAIGSMGIVPAASYDVYAASETHCMTPFDVCDPYLKRDD